jgi:hypothetical protein
MLGLMLVTRNSQEVPITTALLASMVRPKLDYYQSFSEALAKILQLELNPTNVTRRRG